jgi:hypothetical protein
LTVDTTQTVATPRTPLSAYYVAVTRGRKCNTGFVATQSVAEDAPPGTVNETPRRDPLGVLAASAERAEPGLAAIVEAEDDQAEARSLRSIAELFTDAAELATAGRTAAMLDRLTHDGVLTPAQRSAIAADHGSVSLARVLRQAEIAGHDPDAVLRTAVTSRDLGDARSLASTIHHRIITSIDLHPAGDSYTDWVPKVDNPAWQHHLANLADQADARREELGERVTEHRPPWAIEELGPVPEDREDRREWVRRAGAVAAHRELTGHDHPDQALPGAPPKQGQVETYASWRAAWRALDRDEATRAEAEMSDGQLRARVRAYQREEAWAPNYVANELSGTLQSAQRHHAHAQLRQAEAEQEQDTTRREHLQRQAAESRALADVLDRQAAQLDRADEIRARWYLHTANTRAAEQRARTELAARGINADADERDATAEEWLDVHRAEQAADDQRRQITDEHDLADLVEARAADQAAVEPEPSRDAAETNHVDIREIATAEPKREPRAEDD